MLKQVLFCEIIRLINAYFTNDFNFWLTKVYGSDVQATLDRSDLGPSGSFGGKRYRNQKLTKNPIIFVHGVSNTAGEQPLVGASYFLSSGYDWSELYGTTYASGSEGNPMQWVKYSMDCKYVKQVRALIVAVRLYTGRSVNIIAYSLGVPISRKAILGGLCVDTEENLGNSLTNSIDTFIGIAGPNHGVQLKIGETNIPACMFSLLPICNQQTGLFSGLCPKESTFLTITARIKGQNGEKVYDEKNHEQTFRDSLPVQRKMILYHIVI
uniref:Lipase domain-containing protein n=1 Tax=Onchocerca volvulus TaxID=6282 RepID=A0A8R1XN71_ONCVO